MAAGDGRKGALGTGVGSIAMSEPGPDASEIELRLSLLRLRYGDRLSAEQVDDLRRTMQGIVTQIRALRAVPLANADEPLPRFVPLRSDE
jgi:hypothetical protein